MARLREELSNDEYIRWSIFYQRKAQLMELHMPKAG